MNNLIFPIISIIIGINVVLSFVIFSRGYKELKNIFFALFALTTALWGVAIVGFYSDSSFVGNWIFFTHLFAILVSYLFFIFSLYFPSKNKQTKWLILFLSIPLLICLYYLIFSNLIVGNRSGGVEYLINILYPFYSLLLIFYFSFGFTNLYIKSRHSATKLEHKQVLFVLFATLIASTLAIIPDLIFPYLKIFQYTWLGPIFISIIVWSTFMAMLKYYLFNIKVIATELFAGLLVFILLFELFLSTTATEVLVRVIILILVTIFSYLLIRGVYKEVLLREQLEKANAGQKNLIYIMNHQIKGYLTIDKNIFAELLTDDYGRVPEDAKDIITKGLENSDKGQKYVTYILKDASTESGTFSYDMKKMDFKEVVLNEIENQKKTIENKKLKLNTDISNGDYNIIGDSAQLGEVIRNLIENSICYTVLGGISISLKNKADKIIFSIKDTGVGIKEEDRDKIFKVGGVSNDSIKINANSFGYGLAFVKGVIEKHKGRAWFESEGYNKGSTFFVELPVK